MKNYSLFIGIDISKSTLDIIGLNPQSQITLQHLVIANTRLAVKQFLKKSAIDKSSTLVVFENTGIYGHNLSQVLSQADVDFAEVSALEIHRSLGINRGKSDKKDAFSIAKYAISHLFELELSHLADYDINKLKLLYCQSEKIVKAIGQFKSIKESELFLSKDMTRELARSNDKLVRGLKKALKEVESLISKLIKSNLDLDNNYNLAKTVPGIGVQLATYLIIVTHNFTRFSNSRKLACFGGVAPFPYQSGSSIHGRTKVSHLADKKLKTLLNMGALSVMKCDYQMREYYDRKVAEGKNKMLVLNNLRNKMLSHVFAVKIDNNHTLTHTNLLFKIYQNSLSFIIEYDLALVAEVTKTPK
ncbi:IS110 family transposase [Carboxylicivirga sp. A043]|uniref:IS110 family transposase n=1 Tax=Carboxylicivirga litoralis TaxID=2816963 RepID=UPI0021CB502A|nr:IS110 family transposase [Carboxylicivirga sp. A043]MCU4157333.1 IS110 family transposase [Carboxylicivirga sp. A043]